MKIRSIKDLALQLGISKTTVSFVLSGQGDLRGVSKETQEKVLAYARQHQFKPSQLGRNLSTGRSQTMGLIVPNLSDPFYARIFSRISDLFYQKGYVVAGVSSDESEEKERHLIKALKQRGVDGLLLATCLLPGNDWLSKFSFGRPVVLFDRDSPGSGLPVVAVDNEQGSWRLTSELIARGHRDIALVYVTPWLSTIQHRINGFRRAMREAGLDGRLDLESHIDVRDLRNQMHNALMRFCNQERPATAVVLLNNVLGAEAVYCLHRLWTMPHKPALACFDDIDLFDYVNPPVISVAQPLDAIAGACVDTMMKLMDAKKDAGLEPKPVKLIETTLKIR